MHVLVIERTSCLPDISGRKSDRLKQGGFFFVVFFLRKIHKLWHFSCDISYSLGRLQEVLMGPRWPSVMQFGWMSEFMNTGSCLIWGICALSQIVFTGRQEQSGRGKPRKCILWVITTGAHEHIGGPRKHEAALVTSSPSVLHFKCQAVFWLLFSNALGNTIRSKLKVW